MATGPLRFRTPHITELPTIQSTRQAPGFAYVAVPTQTDDPSKHWGTTNRKRARNATTTTASSHQSEALTARQKREVERKINALNDDRSNKEVAIPKGAGGGGGGGVKVGRTTNTKKILGSGKTFAHFLDDEEAEMGRTGRRDVDVEVGGGVGEVGRASKVPLARRKGRESGDVDVEMVDVEGEEEEDDDGIPGLPSADVIEALLSEPMLSFNQARVGPPVEGTPPARKFCETCGYWGRVRCMKCGTMICSVECKDAHDQFKCLKMYA